MADAKMISTQDHHLIKEWIKDHKGTPARLGYDSTGREEDPLTVWFEEEENELNLTYQRLDWEEFFAIFDHHDFVFTYETVDGKDKFVGITPS